MKTTTITKERKVLVSAKIPAELKEKLQKIAKEERREVSNVIFLLLDTHPRTQGKELPKAA